MSIVSKLSDVKAIYEKANKNGWVIPCLCSENLTTTEAILKATQDFGKKHGIKNPPVIIAITCNYDHRSQAANYTNSRITNAGLKLFTGDIKILAEEGGPYSDVDVMIHLDHIQHDLDEEIYNGDLSDYASIMFDASNLPFDENIRKTAEYVKRRGGEILIEGACDEIVDATGTVHNALTTPEKAKRYMDETGVDLIVANLGTEHRASAKDLQYHGDIAKKIKAVIGEKIVLHGTSSVSNEQVKELFSDGVCKVNIWTLLERDSAPVLFETMLKNAVKVAGKKTVERLIAEGYLTEKALEAENANLGYFTTMFRQDIVFEKMTELVTTYLDMWYKI